VRLPRRVLQKIKDGIGGRGFMAYMLLISFVVCTPIGVFFYSTGAGFVSIGACSLVGAMILGAE
jgi:hypothetical protein